jgi:hypothetical protein
MRHTAERLCIPVRRRYANSNERRLLEAERERLLVEISTVDEELLALAERRKQLRDDADMIRDTLWPREPWWHARRPDSAGKARLRPVSNNAAPLWGIHLRKACLAILERHGTQSLADLHSLLHVYGYRIGGTRPVQDLADAMGHEVECGRAVRVRRGHYRPRVEPVDRPAPVERWPERPDTDVDPAAVAALPHDGARPTVPCTEPDLVVEANNGRTDMHSQSPATRAGPDHQ